MPQSVGKAAALVRSFVAACSTNGMVLLPPPVSPAAAPSCRFCCGISGQQRQQHFTRCSRHVMRWQSPMPNDTALFSTRHAFKGPQWAWLLWICGQWVMLCCLVTAMYQGMCGFVELLHVSDERRTDCTKQDFEASAILLQAVHALHGPAAPTRGAFHSDVNRPSGTHKYLVSALPSETSQTCLAAPPHAFGPRVWTSAHSQPPVPIHMTPVALTMCEPNIFVITSTPDTKLGMHVVCCHTARALQSVHACRYLLMTCCCAPAHAA